MSLKKLAVLYIQQFKNVAGCEVLMCAYTDYTDRISEQSTVESWLIIRYLLLQLDNKWTDIQNYNYRYLVLNTSSEVNGADTFDIVQ